MAEPKKPNPWQDRDRLGGPQAFVMTVVEALINPLDYYERLTVREHYHEPIIFCFFNSLFLIWPLLSRITELLYLLALVLILCFVPVFIAGVSFVCQFWLARLNIWADHRQIFYLLAFATPAFAYALVPVAGYFLASGYVLILAAIALKKLAKNDLAVLIPVLVFVPLLVLIPYQSVHVVQKWSAENPRRVPRDEATKVLKKLSDAAELYARAHQGVYPGESGALTRERGGPLAADYCGQTRFGYRFICDFRKVGYYIRAEPEGWFGRGQKPLVITTNGKWR